MEQNPSSEANSRSSSQEIPRLLWKLKVLYRVPKSPSLVLSWARRIQSTTSHPMSLRSVLILSSYLFLRLPSGLFPSGFLTEILYTFLISPIRAKSPTYLILLDFITLIIFVKGASCESSPDAVIETQKINLETVCALYFRASTSSN